MQRVSGADIADEALPAGGFRAEEAASWAEATSMLDDRYEEFCALFTDINLGRGHASGWDLARHAHELRPDTPVLYITGGNANAWAANAVPHERPHHNPFAPAQRLLAVAQRLNPSD